MKVEGKMFRRTTKLLVFLNVFLVISVLSLMGGMQSLVQAAPDSPTYSFSISPTSASMSTYRVTLTISNVLGVTPPSSTWFDPDDNSVSQGCISGQKIREYFYSYGALYKVEDYFYISPCTRDSGTYTVNVGSSYAGSFTITAPRTSYYIPIAVTAPSAPHDFSKVDPIHGATNSAYLSLFLSWESVNADSYDYCYDTSDDQACTGWTSTGTDTQVALTNLSMDTTYYWQVRATNALGTTYANGGADAFWSFTTGNESSIWIQQTDDAGWSDRNSHSGVALSDDSIVIMGGWAGSRMNDVWRSADFGVSWTRMTDDAGWNDRRDHTTIALSDNSIIVMGGHDGSSNLNDVWRSTDLGATWTQMTGSAPWSARSSFIRSCTSLSDNSIIMMGGWDGGYPDDVWRSTDNGANWTRMTDDAPWSGRAGAVAVTLSDDSIVLMGGSDSSDEFNDVWRSIDMGATWTRLTAAASWSARTRHTAVVLSDDSIVLMGGRDSNNDELNDVWISTDMGTTWTQIMAHAQWTARYLHTSVALSDDSIVVMGGWADALSNDVWRLLSIE
jgi:photosystem II stability/assembly factor-like uncharacterized protein